MKTALYRKYRPRRFCDVIGQDAVRAALKNQIASARFGHSYIFTGIRGTGKTTLARILAKAVNCPNTKDGEPCGVCDICVGIDEGTMLDITEIDAASNNSVDSIRELREETAFTPNVCAFRVYIIDEVHMLSASAWAALLKIMEEPPAHVIFILATTEIHKVPATILSRCQRYDLRRIPKEKIAALLLDIAKSEGISLTGDGALSIARLADGAMRDALSLLDTSSSLGGEIDSRAVSRLAGVADKSYLASLVDDIARGDIERLFGDLRSLYESSIDPVRLCYELLRRFRDLLALALAGESALEGGSSDELAVLSAQQKLFTVPQLLGILDKLTSTADKLAFAPDRTLALELALVNLCGGGRANSAPSAENRAHASAPTQPETTAASATGTAAHKASPDAAITEAQPRAAAAATDSAPSRQAESASAPAASADAEPPDGCGESFAPLDDAPPWYEPEPQASQDTPALDDSFFTAEPEPSPAPLDEADSAADDGELEDEADSDDADDDLFENIKRAAASKPAAGEGPPPLETERAKAEQSAPNGFVPEGMQSFERWGEVLAAMKQECPMIYGFLDRSRAYLDGARLLIDGEDKFRVIKNDRSKLSEVERVVRETAGLEIKASAYEAPAAEQKSGAAAELDDLFERAELNNITIEEITS